MGVDDGRRIILSEEEPENGLRPSASFLFRSVARIFGGRGIGILLSGMGRDGAEELKMMKDARAVTFAQNKESSVVFGMPGEAIKLDAATHVLSPEEIGAALSGVVNKTGGKR
jgi:two-component system chemotaxis response regulator CheB